MTWLRIAHRGASGSAPEHTASAFRRAVDLAVDMIELDVQLSADHQLIVMHDLTLERTSNGQGPVRDRTLAELKSFDCGSWYDSAFAGEKILSLPEVIGLLPANVALNVEIKALEGDWAELVANLSTLLRRTARLGSTIISSFQVGALRALRQIELEARIGLLTHDASFRGIWDVAEELSAYSIHPFFALLDRDWITEAHRHNCRVITWTVNQPADMERLVAWGVDGVISDHPEHFARIAIDSNR